MGNGSRLALAVMFGTSSPMALRRLCCRYGNRNSLQCARHFWCDTQSVPRPGRSSPQGVNKTHTPERHISRARALIFILHSAGFVLTSSIARASNFKHCWRVKNGFCSHSGSAPITRAMSIGHFTNNPTDLNEQFFDDVKVIITSLGTLSAHSRTRSPFGCLAEQASITQGGSPHQRHGSSLAQPVLGPRATPQCAMICLQRETRKHLLLHVHSQITSQPQSWPVTQHS